MASSLSLSLSLTMWWPMLGAAAQMRSAPASCSGEKGREGGWVEALLRREEGGGGGRQGGGHPWGGG